MKLKVFAVKLHVFTMVYAVKTLQISLVIVLKVCIIVCSPTSPLYRIALHGNKLIHKYPPPLAPQHHLNIPITPPYLYYTHHHLYLEYTGQYNMCTTSANYPLYTHSNTTPYNHYTPYTSLHPLTSLTSLTPPHTPSHPLHSSHLMIPLTSLTPITSLTPKPIPLHPSILLEHLTPLKPLHPLHPHTLTPTSPYTPYTPHTYTTYTHTQSTLEQTAHKRLTSVPYSQTPRTLATEVFVWINWADSPASAYWA